MAYISVFRTFCRFSLCYELMLESDFSPQISSTLLPYPSEKAEGGDVTSESAEVGPCLMCVARRIPQNEKQSGVPFEQFTTKLDTSGKIIGVDTSGVSSTYSQYLNKVSRRGKICLHLDDNYLHTQGSLLPPSSGSRISHVE